MTEKLTALRELEGKVEADDDIPKFSPVWKAALGATMSDPYSRSSPYAAHNGSLDAAMALMKSVLPGWTVNLIQNMHHKHWNAFVTRIKEDGAAIDYSANHNDNPARALLLAIIHALIAEEEA